MSFVWKTKQSVESSEGYVLRSGGRFAFEYVESDHVLRLEGEDMYANLGHASFGFSFDPGWRTARWQPPYENDPILEHDRQRIVRNIEEAMAFMDGTARFR